ncbi:MAG: hypothetical protein MPJ78_01920 [Hyphomicrobiaceae bacterium]|nr:hypothetical protein [Hyphomicrobiaceae bacterium]
MQELINSLLGDVSIAGYHISIIALIAAGSLVIGLVSRNLWFSIVGVLLLFFFYLFLPAVSN